MVCVGVAHYLFLARLSSLFAELIAQQQINLPSSLFTSQGRGPWGRESQSENAKRYHRAQDDASMCDVTILTCAWALILSEHHSR